MVEIWGRLTEQQSRNQTKVLRVLRAFAVKVQPRIHREAAKSAKISRRKILSCQQSIFGLVVQVSWFFWGATIQQVSSHSGQARNAVWITRRNSSRLALAAAWAELPPLTSPLSKRCESSSPIWSLSFICCCLQPTRYERDPVVLETRRTKEITACASGPRGESRQEPRLVLKSCSVPEIQRSQQR